ncbi:MAG: hypothetical protein R3B06_30865 [Kofleriaceae bacterium]
MRVALVVTAALALAAGCHRSEPRGQHKPLPPDQAEQVLHDRLWLDHAPRSLRDAFDVMVFTPGGGAIHQRRTVWKGDFEVFLHEVDGGELAFHLPASGTDMHSTFRIARAAGPDGADHKLVIDHPPLGPREYWGWKMDGQATDAWLAAHFGALAK